MNYGLISKRYAKALLEFAAARGEDAALYGRMKTLLANAIAVPMLQGHLRNPMVERADKLALLCNAMGGGNTEESGKKFAQLLLDNRREYLAQNVAVCYTALYRRIHRISTVSLTAAAPLSNSVIERIRANAEREAGGTADISVRLDPRIVGGVIFQIGDLRLDASVAGQLARVRKGAA